MAGAEEASERVAQAAAGGGQLGDDITGPLRAALRLPGVVHLAAVVDQRRRRLALVAHVQQVAEVGDHAEHRQAVQHHRQCGVAEGQAGDDVGQRHAERGDEGGDDEERDAREVQTDGRGERCPPVVPFHGVLLELRGSHRYRNRRSDGRMPSDRTNIPRLCTLSTPLERAVIIHEISHRIG